MNIQKQSLVRVWILGGGNTSQVCYHNRFDSKNGPLYLDGQYLLRFRRGKF